MRSSSIAARKSFSKRSHGCRSSWSACIAPPKVSTASYSAISRGGPVPRSDSAHSSRSTPRSRISSANTPGPASGWWTMARARIDGILADEVGMDASERVRRPIETDEAPAPIGPYSQAVVADGVLYCSGQVPLDPESGELVDGGVAEQARRCLESLDAVCRAAGTRLSQAARIGIFLTDMETFAQVNEVYASFFSEPFPVRTTVGVSALPKGSLIEMDATVPLSSASAQ